MKAIWNTRIYYELAGTFTLGKRWLDLGCGRGEESSEIQRVRDRLSEKLYVGIDIDFTSLRDNRARNKAMADGKHLPFPDESFDLVTSDMVLEHVEAPDVFLSEARRVLTVGGLLLLHTSCSVHYELLAGRLLSSVFPRHVYLKAVSAWSGRHTEDIFPVFYKANTRGSLSRVLRKAGFGLALIGYLETPLGAPEPLRTLERLFRELLPLPMKASLLAVGKKRDSDPPIWP